MIFFFQAEDGIRDATVTGVQTCALPICTFREDLFYRLNVFPVQIPSLCERVNDIPLLVEYLIDRYAKKAGKNIRKIEKKTLELFKAYRWPGDRKSVV